MLSSSNVFIFSGSIFSTCRLCLPVRVASVDGFPCWPLLLPDLETNSTRSDALFQLPQVVGFLPLMLSACVVPAVCIQDEVSEQHIPHVQHQMEFIHNNAIQLNIEQWGMNAARCLLHCG